MPFVPGQLLVQPRRDLAEADFAAFLQAHGAVQQGIIGNSNARIVAVPEDRATEVLAALKEVKQIEFAERDYIAWPAWLPNDPGVVSGQAWHLAKVQAPAAWETTPGNTNVVVAVLDSGAQLNHPDLSDRLLPGYNFIAGNEDATDDYGHGTAVAGAVAATGNNGLGVAGMAFGCALLPIKVCDASGAAPYSAIAGGIRYAADHGAQVVNLSLVGEFASTTLQEAVNYAWGKNAVVVAAAGNTGGTTPQYPAACQNVVAVSSLSPNDTLSGFSSYGPHITVTAPGENIWTTQSRTNEPFGAWSGTSLASPLVAGVAALVAAANGSLSNTQIVSLLTQTADDLGPAGHDASFGWGRVNAARAVGAALDLGGAGPPPEVSPPPVNLAPVVALANPLSGARFLVGNVVTLAANASDGDGAVVDVIFLAGTNALGVATNAAASAGGAKTAGEVPAPFRFNWQPTQAGFYSLLAVAVDQAGSRATSSPVAIQVLAPETLKPRLALTSAPGNGARLMAPQVLLNGMANDGTGVARVEVQLNNGTYEIASGTTNWSATLTLLPGKNTVRVRSVDFLDNVSTELVRTYTYVVLAPLVLHKNGWGAVKPDLDGQLLEIGRTHKVTASPGLGQIFAGWQGAAAQSAKLSFVMQSNLVLVANFVPNPFPPVSGSYAGLVWNTNGVSPADSGRFTLQVARAGALSGKLWLGGRSQSFKGQFGATGDANVVANRSLLSPLVFILHLDLDDGSDQVLGSVTDGNWLAVLVGHRNVFHASANPAPQAGKRALLLLQSAAEASQTTATGRVQIATSGLAKVGGKFADGRPFSSSAVLAKNGDYPFHVTWSSGNEVLLGWMNFPTAPTNGVTGSVVWTALGTNSFSTTLQAVPQTP